MKIKELRRKLDKFDENDELSLTCGTDCGLAIAQLEVSHNGKFISLMIADESGEFA